ncbi:MAG TPA: peptidyl-prolyl cis-trans isomerase [Methylocystis sp.]|nr:peptidyl-prolyl cis-trans isomerase [Methylocystis sp.]
MSLTLRLSNTDFRRGICALGLAAALGAGLGAAAKAEVLAKANGVEITDSEVRLAEDELGPKIPRQLQGKQREDWIVNYLIDKALVVQAAKSRKIEDSPEYAKRFAYFRDRAAFDSLIEKVTRDADTDETVKAAYQEAHDRTTSQIEYHFKALQVATEEEAKAARQRVEAGEDWDKVVADYNKEPAKDAPGDAPKDATQPQPKAAAELGWLGKDRVTALFGESAAQLGVGQVTNPKKTAEGWRIGRLAEKRNKAFPSLEQIRPQVERYVQQKAQNDFIKSLRDEAKIERASPPPEAAAPGAPPSPEAVSKPAGQK